MQNTNKLIGRLTVVTCLAWLSLLWISDSDVDDDEPSPSHLRRELMLGKGKLTPKQERAQQRLLQEDRLSSLSSSVLPSLESTDEFDIPEWLNSDIINISSKHIIQNNDDQQTTSFSFTPPHFLSTIQYNLQDAIESTTSFMNTVGILLYTPRTKNQFKMYYNTKDMKWAGVASCRKLSMAFKEFVLLLRHEFPDRFDIDSTSTSGDVDVDELAIVISGGDYPKLSRQCLVSFPNTSEQCISHKAPVLQFGSVFRQQSPTTTTYSQSLPNMLMMPMSATHLTCFTQFGLSDGQNVCDSFNSEKTVPNAERYMYMVFGDGSTKFEVR